MEAPSGENWRAAFAQADGATPRKPRIWTGERLAAAKKKWAANKEKFSTCSNELEEKQKKERVRVNAQGTFLEACMRRP